VAIFLPRYPRRVPRRHASVGTSFRTCPARSLDADLRLAAEQHVDFARGVLLDDVARGVDCARIPPLPSVGYAAGSDLAPTAREVRSCPRSEARRRLAAPAVHVASAKVLLGRQKIVAKTPKLQVVHAVRAAQRVRFAVVVQLQAASPRAASPAT